MAVWQRCSGGRGSACGLAVAVAVALCALPLRAGGDDALEQLEKATKEAAAQYGQKKMAEQIQGFLQAKLDAELKKLKMDAIRYPTDVKLAYVQALEFVASEKRDTLREIAEGMASGDPEKVQEAQETLAVTFAEGVKKFAPEKALATKVLGKVIENVGTIRDASGALGRAAAGDYKPCLRVIGTGLINQMGLAGPVGFFQQAYGTMRWAKGAFMDAQVEDFYQRYAKLRKQLERPGGRPEDLEPLMRNQFELGGYGYVFRDRDEEIQKRLIEDLKPAKHLMSEKLWNKLTAVDKRKLIGDILATFKARYEQEKERPKRERARREAEKLARDVLGILKQAYFRAELHDWYKRRTVTAETLAKFLSRAKELAKERGISVREAARLLAERVVPALRPKAKLKPKFKPLGTLAVLVSGRGVRYEMAAQPKPDPALAAGGGMGASGSFKKRGPFRFDPPKEAGPFAVPAAGKLRGYIHYRPPIGVHWSLFNNNTGWTIHFRPKLHRGAGGETQVGSIRMDGHAKKAMGEVSWPGPGELRFMFWPPAGGGPLTTFSVSQSWSARAKIIELSRANEGFAGSRLGQGDTVRVAPGGEAVLLLPNGARLTLRKGAAVRFSQTKRGVLDVHVLASKKGAMSYASAEKTPRDPLTVQFHYRGKVIRKKGTEFALEVDGETARLRVAEGAVTVADEAGRAVDVAARQQYDFATGATSPLDVAKQGRAAVAGVPLGELLVDDLVEQPYGIYLGEWADGRVGGEWVLQDPGRDTTLATPERGTLRLAVPHGNDFGRDVTTAPRLLHKATGDFDLSAELQCSGQCTDWALAEFLLRSPCSYIGSQAKQMSREGEAAHYRRMGECWRRAVGKDKLQVFRRDAWHEWPDAPTGPVHVLFSRRGPVWRTYWSRDGRSWRLATRDHIDLHDTVWVGWCFRRVAADGKRDEAAVFTLRNVRLVTSEAGFLPDVSWDIVAADGRAEVEGEAIALSLDGSKPGEVTAWTPRRFDGDFDVVVRVEDTGPPVQPGRPRVLSLVAATEDLVSRMYVRQRWEHPEQPRLQECIYYHQHKDYCGAAGIRRGKASGKLRLVRCGGECRALAWEGGGWRQLDGGFKEKLDRPVYVGVSLHAVGGAPAVRASASFEVERLTDQVRPARRPIRYHELTSIVWQHAPEGHRALFCLRLLPGGGFDTLPKNADMRYKSWELQDSYLIFYDDRGHPAVRFASFGRDGGRWVVEGPVPADPWSRFVLVEVARVGELATWPDGPGGDYLFHQWATEAKASSQGGDPHYAPGRATGVPNVYMHSDSGEAWSPKALDGTTEWLELTYKQAVVPRHITVRESCEPGFVTKLEAHNPANGQWATLWQGKDTTTKDRLMFSPPLAGNTFATSRIRLTIDTNVPGRNTIDAVELVGVRAAAAPATTRPATAPAEAGPTPPGAVNLSGTWTEQASHYQSPKLVVRHAGGQVEATFTASYRGRALAWQARGVVEGTKVSWTYVYTTNPFGWAGGQHHLTVGEGGKRLVGVWTSAQGQRGSASFVRVGETATQPASPVKGGLVFDSTNSNACQLTDKVTFTLARPTRISRLVIWYRWQGGEQTVAYELHGGGRVVHRGAFRRGKADPYAAQWAQGVDAPSLRLGPGAYSIRVARKQLGQNAASRGNGFLQVHGAQE